VLALLRPDLRFVLLESMARRVTFLTECVAELDLANVTVHRDRAEDVAGILTADVVVARAVAPLGRLAELALGLTRPGGLVLAIKGSSAADEIARSRPDLRRLGVRDVEIIRAGAAPDGETGAGQTAGEGSAVATVVRFTAPPAAARRDSRSRPSKGRSSRAGPATTQSPAAQSPAAQSPAAQSSGGQRGNYRARRGGRLLRGRPGRPDVESAGPPGRCPWTCSAPGQAHHDTAGASWPPWPARSCGDQSATGYRRDREHRCHHRYGRGPPGHGDRLRIRRSARPAEPPGVGGYRSQGRGWRWAWSP
jgi:hypothetical protein